MSIFIFFIFFLLISFSIYKLPFFKLSGISTKILISLFLLKLAVGLSLNYIYSSYYTNKNEADIYKYYNDGEALHDIIAKSPSAFVKIFFDNNTNTPEIEAYSSTLKNWKEQDPNYLKITNSHNSNLFNSQRFIIRTNAIISFFSFGNIAINTLFFCLIAFIGQLLLFKTFLHFAPDRKYALVAAIFLVPSVLLWTGSILKENFIYLGLGLFCYNAFITRKNRAYNILYASIGLIILLYAKPYIAGILLASFSCYSICKHFNLRPFLSYIIIPFSLLLLALGLRSIIPSKDPLISISNKMNVEKRIGMGGYYLSSIANDDDQIFIEEINFKYKPNINDSCYYTLPKGTIYRTYKQGIIDNSKYNSLNDTATFYLMLSYKRAGSYIELPELNPSLKSFVSFFPYVIKNVFIEPSIFKAESILSLMASIENIGIIFLLLIGILIYKHNPDIANLTSFAIFFSCSLLVLIGYTSPIAGNIVRFKIPATTLLLISIAITYNKDKVNSIINKIISILQKK